MSKVELPALGENVNEAEVVTILVSEGDRVERDQGLLELEADKATLEVPAPYAGTVTRVLVERGDMVSAGQAIAEMDQSDEPAAEPDAEADAEAAAPTDVEADADAEVDADAEAPTEGEVEPEPADDSASDAVMSSPARSATGSVSASPSTRRLARQLGVDLDAAARSLGQHSLSADDVKRYVRELPRPRRVTRRRHQTAVERTAAARLVRTWQAIPHVTHHEVADVTELERARKTRRRRDPELPLTITALVVRAVVAAVEQEPDVNASYDAEARDVIRHGPVHCGIAVDTERGLMVPVVRNAERMTTAELARAIDAVAARARARRLAADEIGGATFTVSNLGGIGGVAFSPVINEPGVATLGLARVREQPRRGPDDAVRWCDVLPLSLSYDHRAVDGATAARFARRTVELLESPFELLLAV